MQWAWNAFVAINATTQVGSGYSSITDVNAPGGGNFTNFQESFLFAEVLKYRCVHGNALPEPGVCGRPEGVD